MKRPASPFSNAPSRAGFTLVELLGVIAIIITLVGLSARVLRGASGPTLSTAGNATVDLINEARQIAISKNTKTMVAVLTSGTNAGRRLTILSYSPETTANNGWSQTGKWQELPVAIKIEDTPSIAYPDYGEHLFGALPAGVTVRSNDSQNTFKCAIFLPDGRPQATDTKSRLVTISDLTSNGANKFEIILPSASGNPIVRRE